jgi:hypothetical protein
MAKRKIYRFRGNEGSSMDENLVKKWIQQHADHHETRAHFFGKEVLEKILNQPGCMGLRIYYAMDDNSKKQLIIVGADEKGNNMWPSKGPKPKKGKKMLGGSDGNTTVDNSRPCPPYCSSTD